MSSGGAASLMHKTKEEGAELLYKYFTMFDGLGSAIANAKKFLKEHGYVEGLLGRRRRLPDLFLPKYEVYLKENNDAKNFNPFINCTNRTTKDEKIIKWEGEVAKAIAESQKYQRDRAAKAGKTWTDNGEMSNAKFQELANKAYQDGVIIQANTGRIAQAERQCFNALIQGSAGTLTKKAMIDIYRDPQLRAWDTHLIISVHDEVLVECPEEYAEQVEKRLPEIMINAAIELGITAPAMKCDPYNVSRWYADSAAVAIRAEFDKLEKGDEKKGILPLTREEALQKVYDNHIEFPKEAIYKSITEGIDLEY